MMKPRVLMAVFVLGVVLGFPSVVRAQKRSVSPTITLSQADLSLTQEASAAASASAQPAATSAAQIVVEKVVQKTSDITEPQGPVKGRLERYLDAQQIGPLSWTNPLQHAIRRAVAAGVPANTIVLILLFPVVAAIIAASRHLIGLRGFGIFVPAMLSVALVATGLLAGVVLFLVILGMGTLGRYLFKRLRMQYLPRMALLLWLVSIGVLGTLFLAPVVHFGALANINIFSILILMLLAENFVEVQYGKSGREARELTVETMILALISSLVLSLDFMQRMALLHPEILLALVAVFDVFLGRYVGLRYTEYRKFKKIVSK